LDAGGQLSCPSLPVARPWAAFLAQDLIELKYVSSTTTSSGFLEVFSSSSGGGFGSVAKKNQSIITSTEQIQQLEDSLKVNCQAA
jgi:hypothetical protein